MTMLQVQWTQWQEMFRPVLLLFLLPQLHWSAGGPHLTVLCSASWTWGPGHGSWCQLHWYGCPGCFDRLPGGGVAGNIHCGNLQEMCLWTGNFTYYRIIKDYLIIWQGDYKCDAPDGDIPEHHIAAWDHPSMDYISKDDENIIFTLCQVWLILQMTKFSF